MCVCACACFQALRKKNEAAKIQAQVKKRMEARDKSDAEKKKKIDADEMALREAGAARRAAAAAKRQVRLKSVGGNI